MSGSRNGNGDGIFNLPILAQRAPQPIQRRTDPRQQGEQLEQLQLLGGVLMPGLGGGSRIGVGVDDASTVDIVDVWEKGDAAVIPRKEY